MATAARYFEQPRQSLNRVQRRYLKPLNAPERMVRRMLFGLTWGSVRALLRLRVEGLENLPHVPPFILAPSHTSSLDPFLLATALPYKVIKECQWAAAARAIMKNQFRRTSNRLAGSIPIWRGRSALSVGATVLENRRNLIWFPEGHRTRSGELQEFRPGIGLLAVHSGAPVIPIRILGGYQAMPPGKKLPKVGSRVTIRIGRPLQADQQPGEDFETAANRFTQRLYEETLQLGDETSTAS
jgi:long-chain acyl-CoA synthetase